jgi:Peptidase family M23
MKRLVALLPVLIAFQAGAPPALAWTWPVDGPVLRPFALGDDPYVAGQHRGIDVAAARGSPVRAPTAGTVSFAGTVPGGGRTVTLLTEDGYAVTLLHLGGIGVPRGAPVAEGSAVGTVGPSGDPEHPQGYVHLGVRVAEDPNAYLDPLAFLPAREVATPPAPDPPGEPEPREAPAPAPAPVPAPAPGPASEPPATPAVPAAAAAGHAAPAVETSSRGHRSAAPEAGAATAPSSRAARRPSAGAPAPSRVVAAAAEEGAGPPVPPRTARRSFELAAVPAASPAAAPPRPAGGARAVPVEEEPGLPLGSAAAAGGLAALVALAVALFRLRLGQFGHARPADAAAPVLADAARRSAEDARRLGPAEDDRLVPHRDLQWVSLSKSEALADLDRDDDPAQLVEVPDDARRRPAATVVANPRAHRVRHQSSRRWSPERLVAR